MTITLEQLVRQTALEKLAKEMTSSLEMHNPREWCSLCNGDCSWNDMSTTALEALADIRRTTPQK